MKRPKVSADDKKADGGMFLTTGSDWPEWLIDERLR